MDKDICCKCGKDVSPIGTDYRMTGINVSVKLEAATPDKISYNNKQLGKYSNGLGECDVCICFECYIDGLFQIKKKTT
jgi:hypothetical protein